MAQWWHDEQEIMAFAVQTADALDCREVLHNMRLDEQEFVADLWFEAAVPPLPLAQLRVALLRRLRERRGLQAVRVTVDIDVLCGLRFLNIHTPLDKHIWRRMAIVEAVARRWMASLGAGV